MYALLHALLSDRKGDTVFTCFGLWHFGYIAITVVLIAILCRYLKGKPRAAGARTATKLIHVAFGLYIADFFLMPFAYEQIDMEKLPFHVCTAMCVMCFLSRHVPRLKSYTLSLARLGFVSNLVYLIYPAGVMWHQVHPLCYRVVQTLLFHSLMTAYGYITLAYEGESLSRQSLRRDLVTVVGMTLWAVLGNILYTGAAGTYDHAFNWFFVTADPFGILDRKLAPFLMPFLNVLAFMAVELSLYGVFHCLRKKE